MDLRDLKDQTRSLLLGLVISCEGFCAQTEHNVGKRTQEAASALPRERPSGRFDARSLAPEGAQRCFYCY